jgi:hypothetical protein
VEGAHRVTLKQKGVSVKGTADVCPMSGGFAVSGIDAIDFWLMTFY